MLKVVIAIQARSTNTRLPGKCLMDINGIPMLDRVINAAQKSAGYLNNGKGNVSVDTCLLVPFGDEIARSHRHRIATIEGPEHDVLTRYAEALKRFDSDYVVRLTSDCPMIPPFLITKHVLIATNHQFDYTSNVEPEIRTSPDGFDCEVISKKMLQWVDKNALDKHDREHVTTFIREKRPSWGKYANLVGYNDISALKLSVDTHEDLEFVRMYDQVLHEKIEKAKRIGEGFFRI